MPVLDRVSWLDRSGFALGLPVGPLLVVVGYAVLRGTDVVMDGWHLWAVALWPVLVTLVVALVLPGHRRWWLSLTAGCVAGTVAVVATVVGLISGLAYLLSDPAGQP